MRPGTERREAAGWRRHFFYRAETLKTTWKLRLSVVVVAVLVILMGAITRKFWSVKIAESLICTEQISQSDALLLENFDPDYLVFERAAALRRAAVAGRIVVPVQTVRNSERINPVSKGLAELMARVARIPEIEVIPIEETEPISLNAAYQIRDFLRGEHVKSIVVVTPAYRSLRSLLVYSSVLTPAGITVGCVPAFGTHTPANWTESWHGMQEVMLQFFKLQYYRFWVLW